MRYRVFASVAILALSGAVAMGAKSASAQDAATADHPIMGVWEMRVDLGQGDTNCPAQLAFAPGGSAVDVDCEGIVAVGTWESTGDRSANLTFTSYNPDLGRYEIRVAIDVSDNGDAFTGSFTFELIDAETGKGQGQYGPGSATGVRQAAEGPGAPVGPISELLGQAPASPEATPAA